METGRTGHRKAFLAEVKRGCSELGSGVKEKSHNCSTVNEAESEVRKSQNWAEDRSGRIL